MSSSSNFLLCFGGFKRLSGMTRAAGGGPANSRARRRASLPAENFLDLRLRALILFSKNQIHHAASVSSLSSKGRREPAADSLDSIRNSFFN